MKYSKFYKKYYKEAGDSLVNCYKEMEW